MITSDALVGIRHSKPVFLMIDTELTHIDESGASRMVAVGKKQITERFARAKALVRMQPATLQKILDGNMPKGDVFAAVRIAGIQGAKQTSTLIPLCHPLALDAVSITVTSDPPDVVRIESYCSIQARTGVEMEALTAVTIAALTLYDMVKAVDRSITITSVCLLEKSGGASGHFLADQ